MGDDRAGDRRQRIERRATVPLDQRDRLAGLEFSLQHQGRAVRQRRRQRVGAAIGPEERRRHQHAVGWTVALPLADIESVLDDAAMGERHRLGRAAASRGVDNHRFILAVGALARKLARRERIVEARETRSIAHHYDVGECGIARGPPPAGDRRLGHQTPQIGVEIALTEVIERDQQLHAGIGEQPVELIARGPGAERHRDGAGHRRTEERLQPLQPVVDEQPDPVAAPDAAAPQHARATCCAAGQLGVADAARPADDGRRLAPPRTPSRTEDPRGSGWRARACRDVVRHRARSQARPWPSTIGFG